MRKRDIIKKIRYDDYEKVIYITHYDDEEEVIDLWDMDDESVKELYNQLEKTKTFCEQKWFLKWFGYCVFLSLVGSVSFAAYLGLFILGSAYMLNFILTQSKLAKSETVLSIDYFLCNEKFNRDYQEMKGMDFIKMKKNKLDKTKAIDVEYQELGMFQKNEFVFSGQQYVQTIDDVILDYLNNIKKTLSSMGMDSIIYGMTLGAIMAKYDQIEVESGALTDEEKLNYLAELKEFYAEINSNYKKYVRGK